MIGCNVCGGGWRPAWSGDCVGRSCVWGFSLDGGAVGRCNGAMAVGHVGARSNLPEPARWSPTLTHFDPASQFPLDNRGGFPRGAARVSCRVMCAWLRAFSFARVRRCSSVSVHVRQCPSVRHFRRPGPKVSHRVLSRKGVGADLSILVGSHKVSLVESVS